MRTLVAVWLCSAAILLGQSRHVRCLVVDTQGRPVANASIDYVSDRQVHATDAAGRFELETEAPVLVIRKAGYRSALIRPQSTPVEIRVTLERAAKGPSFPVCPESSTSIGIDGAQSRLRFQTVPGVRIGDEEEGADYRARKYFIETPSGLKSITHGGGIMWGAAWPSIRLIARSVKFEEAAYALDRGELIDARGQSPDGTWWREMDLFVESASYHNVDEATARRFDQFLDSACYRPEPRSK